MNAGKMMARLNAKTVRFDVGLGGDGAALDPQDIAAAVARIPAGLMRELFCHVWWPDGAALNRKQLEELLANAQIHEWVRREDLYQTARTRLAIHQAGRNVSWATREYQAAHGDRWPAMVKAGDIVVRVEYYERIRTAVLAELRRPSYCPPCESTGFIPTPEGDVECRQCKGLGAAHASDRSRADAIGIKAFSHYQRTWKPVYDWLMTECRDKIAQADGYFERAVA
jgi:hypothetical protein